MAVWLLRALRDWPGLGILKIKAERLTTHHHPVIGAPYLPSENGRVPLSLSLVSHRVVAEGLGLSLDLQEMFTHP